MTNSFAAVGVLIKTEILSFVLKQKPLIYPTQSYDGSEDNMGTTSDPSRTLCHCEIVAFTKRLRLRQIIGVFFRGKEYRDQTISFQVFSSNAAIILPD